MYRRQGTVKWYDKDKHYGFIIEDGPKGNEIFFHESKIKNKEGVEKDQRVSFNISSKIVKGKTLLEAIDVTLLNE